MPRRDTIRNGIIGASASLNVANPNVANTVHTVSSQQLSPMAGHLYGEQNCQVRLRRKLLTRSRVSSSTCSENLAFATLDQTQTVHQRDQLPACRSMYTTSTEHQIPTVWDYVARKPLTQSPETETLTCYAKNP